MGKYNVVWHATIRNYGTEVTAKSEKEAEDIVTKDVLGGLGGDIKIVDWSIDCEEVNK